jgi:hypothetical protein
MAYRLFTQLAEVETYVGNASGAKLALSVATTLEERVNALLWSSSSSSRSSGNVSNGSDHYITQLNFDNSTLDLMDYDSNLIAVAYGLAPLDRAHLIMDRIATNPCARPNGYGTTVSERGYTAPEFAFGMGDSFVAMGRIAYVDALSLKRVNDSARFNTLLSTLHADLLRNTWMYERWQCEGAPTHNPYYHEYPEVVAMMLRDIKYGINLGFNTITIDPFLPAFVGNQTTTTTTAAGSTADEDTQPRFDDVAQVAFEYHLGGVTLQYSRSAVRLQLARLPRRKRRVVVKGLAPSSAYTWAVVSGALGGRNTAIQTDSSGEIVIDAVQCGGEVDVLVIEMEEAE